MVIFFGIFADYLVEQLFSSKRTAPHNIPSQRPLSFVNLPFQNQRIDTIYPIRITD